ncbi:MAG: sigma-70 family RNA polymerase sigma factor [Kangiellaceae bacterium]
MSEQSKLLHSQIQTAYPQALAKLLIVLNNIQDAEDYLQSAVEKALVKWQEQRPDNPVAWLVQVARNQYIDFYRRQKRQVSDQSVQEQNVEVDLSEEALLLSYNDDLLRLIFTSCHPALNQQTQIILSLKHVLGLSVNEIASALLIPTKTLQQRLLRAKKKIIGNHIQYEVPAKSSWGSRLDGVLKTIYLLFNEGYLSTQHKNPIRTDLCKEAIRLTRLLHIGIRDNSEILGLLALLLHQDARRPARFDQQGNMVLLEHQDKKLWKQRNIQEANSLVYKSLRAGGGTPYALQAAIAALHNHPGKSDETDWPQIYGLYVKLLEQQDNAVIRLNSMVALAKCGKFEKAINQILELQSQLENYPYYYSALAGLYFENKDFKNALVYYQKALRNTGSEFQLRFLQGRVLECEGLNFRKKSL